MSFAGILEFKEAIDVITDSDAFKNMGDGDRLELGYKLVTCNISKVNKDLNIKK